MNSDQSEVDVVVVGAGIHGVGVAQVIAAAGYSVLLCEKSDIGTATSSKSSKLIHGGLRYLESFQFSLVRSCLKERSLLLKNAPSLVKLIPFFIPVYESTQRRPWKINFGLWLYNLLSGFKSPFQKLSREQWLNLDGISQSKLRAVFKYYDAQTDDVLLTRAVAKSAQSLGAEILTNSLVIGCEIGSNGCSVEIKSNSLIKKYLCRVVVNATGAAVNDVLKLCKPPQKELAIDLVQGAHLVLDRPAKKGVYYLEAYTDRRAVFVMPWKDKTLIGTTETRVNESTGEPSPFPQEIDYLLTVYNDYFENEKVTSKDILESFAGLRVLPHEKKSIFARGRDTVLLVDSKHQPRLVTIYGGKLTAYRATAEKVLQKILPTLPKGVLARATSENLPLASQAD